VDEIALSQIAAGMNELKVAALISAAISERDDMIRMKCT
jgi:hypothetical protein